MLAVTPPACARLLSVPLRTVRTAMRSGALDARRSGTRFLIPVDKARAWLDTLPRAYPHKPENPHAA